MKRTIIGLGLAGLLAACGPQQKSEDAPAASQPAAPVVTVTSPAAQVNVADGSAVTGGGLPAFAPAYPGGTVVTTMTAAEAGKHGGVYAFTTSDAVDKVFTFYRSKAERGGLATQTNVETAGARVYAAQGAAGDVAVTAAPQGENSTYVQVTWSAKD